MMPARSNFWWSKRRRFWEAAGNLQGNGEILNIEDYVVF